GLYLIDWSGFDRAFPLDASGKGRLSGHLRAESSTSSSETCVLDPPVEDAHGLRHDLVLSDGTALSGRLLDADGSPLSGWNVGCSTLSSHPYDASKSYVGRSTTTLADGSFVIDGMREGDFDFTAMSPELQRVYLGFRHVPSTVFEL